MSTITKRRPPVDHGTLAADSAEVYSVCEVLSQNFVQEVSVHSTREAAEAATLALGEKHPCGGERHLILVSEDGEIECCETCGRSFTALVLTPSGDCGECAYHKAVLADGRQYEDSRD